MIRDDLERRASLERIMFRAWPLIAALTLAGCVIVSSGVAKKNAQSWVGATVSDLEAKEGEAANVSETSDGGRKYTYYFNTNLTVTESGANYACDGPNGEPSFCSDTYDRNVVSTCTVNYFTDAQGTIITTSTRNC